MLEQQLDGLFLSVIKKAVVGALVMVWGVAGFCVFKMIGQLALSQAYASW